MALLARFVLFREQFDNWSAGLERIGQWQDNYKTEHPEATKDQMDTQFRISIEALEKWKADYKAGHPNATDAEVSAAFDAAWANK